MTPVRPIPRRAFLAGAGASLVASRGAWAQQKRVIRLTLASTGYTPKQMTISGDPRYIALLGELRRLGYFEGENLLVSRYSTSGLPETEWATLARQVVASGPEIIFANGSRLVLALKEATRTIPIVVSVSDPLGYGIVDSLARPGGNITGFSADASPELYGKMIQFLTYFMPRMTHVGYLGTPQTWSSNVADQMRISAQRLNLEVVPMLVSDVVTAETVIRTIHDAPLPKPSGFAVTTGNDFTVFSRQIANTAMGLGLATIAQSRTHPDAGALMSYGLQVEINYRGSAGYIDRILKGTKPADLPVQQPREFEFVINKCTADALKLEIPLGLLVQATEVIEKC